MVLPLLLTTATSFALKGSYGVFGARDAVDVMGCLGEIQDGDGNRPSTGTRASSAPRRLSPSTSTPMGWHWLSECDAPVTVTELLFHSRKVRDSDALREQNDSDQCTECRCAPGQPHAPGCDEAAKVTDAQSNAGPEHVKSCAFEGSPAHPSWVCGDCGQDRYGKPNGVSTWHYDYCRFCGEYVPCTDPRDFGNRLGDRHDGGQFPGQETGVEEETHEDLQGKDADSFAVTSCPECGAVTDIDYGTVKDKLSACQARDQPSLAALTAEGYREMAEESLEAAEAFIGGCEPEPARSAIGAGPLFGDGVRFAHETPRNLRVGARSEHTLDDNPLLNHMDCTFRSCMDIAIAKNEGYAGSADPMANFNDSVRLGVPVPIGVAIRLSDKWARLCRLLQTGKNPLADESITDTILDTINYLAILLYALEDEA